MSCWNIYTVGLSISREKQRETYLSEPSPSALILRIWSDEVVKTCYLNDCLYFAFDLYHLSASTDKKI